MVTRKVLMTGEVVEVDNGRFWVSFTTKTDNGGRIYTTTLRLGLTKLRLGRQVPASSGCSSPSATPRPRSR